MSPNLLHDDVAELLRAGDHRYSTGRRRVVSALHEANAPVTIPEILKISDELTQSSLYRNLAVLEEVGAVTRIITHDDHARFELAETLTDHHHHHLICANCGSVTDFTLSPDTETMLEQACARVAKTANFHIEGHRLDLVGTCADCR